MKQHRRRPKKDKEYIEPLSNYDIQDLVAKMKIPHFHGVFMRDTLSKKSNPTAQECWILNHGSSQSDGTHWTALVKNNNVAFYFDSFGKLPPPLEVIDYLNNEDDNNKNNIRLYYNVKRYQNYGTTICGHLCLKFLYDFWRNENTKKKELKKEEIKHIKTRPLL